MSGNDWDVEWASGGGDPAIAAQPWQWSEHPEDLQYAVPQPDSVPEDRPLPVPGPVAGRRRSILIGSAVAVVVALLAAVGVSIVRTGGHASVAAPQSTTAAAHVNLSGLCPRLAPSLPAKAQGLPLHPSPSTGPNDQQCHWFEWKPPRGSTSTLLDSFWNVSVEVRNGVHVFGAKLGFDSFQEELADPNGDNVEWEPLPGVGDVAQSGIIRHPYGLYPLPPGGSVLPEIPPNGITLPPSAPGKPAHIKVELSSRQGAAVVVRAGTVAIQITWRGAELVPGTPPDKRYERESWTALPPEQARSEAIALAQEVIRLIGS